MKLNVKKTVQVGFAFLSICAFWQMYNAIIPIILTYTFHMNETISGAIMAADNVLALFLLPLFGGISDRCKCKWGKRKPFILFGTIAAVIHSSIILTMRTRRQPNWHSLSGYWEHFWLPWEPTAARRLL